MEQWISVETSNFTPHAMKIIYQRLFFPMHGAADRRGRRHRSERRRGCKTLDVVERQLAKSRSWPAAQFTLADICFMPYIEYLFAGKAGDLIESRTAVARWWNDVSARPSWRATTSK